LYEWLVDVLENSPLGYLYYYIQFTAFHLVLYLFPVAILIPLWAVRRRFGHWEQMLQTPATRADLLWAYLVPRCTLVLLFLYGFYIVMWPWENWWLVRFHDDGPTPDRCWTSLHVVVTSLYFAAVLMFNALAAVWLLLRVRSAVVAAWLLILLTLGLDYMVYIVAGTGIRIPNLNTLEDALFTWPYLLYTLLSMHAHPVFAAVFYPAKGLLCGLMILDITRRRPADRWTPAGARIAS